MGRGIVRSSVQVRMFGVSGWLFQDSVWLLRIDYVCTRAGRPPRRDSLCVLGRALTDMMVCLNVVEALNLPVGS